MNSLFHRQALAKKTLCALAPLTLAHSALGVTLFQSDLSNGIDWGVNVTGADTSAIFGYNYGLQGIPEAPNSLGGAATSGLRMAANQRVPAAAESLIVYPIGQNFTGNYTLRFDAWINFDVDAYYNNSQNATTEFIGGGIGYDDSATGIGPGAQFLTTSDGGSANDWRAFTLGTLQMDDAMTGGTQNGLATYYSDFLPGGSLPPLGQGQVNSDGSIGGSPGFQWITWEITANSDNVVWYIEKPGGERLEIISYDKTAPDSLTNTDGNISLVYADLFSSVAPNPDYTFGLIDNVVVTGASVPETGSASFLVLGLGALAFHRKTRR